MRPTPRSLIPLVIIGFFIGLALPGNNILVAILLVITIFGLPVIYSGLVYYYPMSLISQGKLEQAEQHYTRILDWHVPANRTYLFTRRAAVRNARGNVQGAIDDYSTAIKQSRSASANLYGMRSALYLAQRDFGHALEDTDKVLEMNPQSEIGLANRAAARMFLGDVQGAIADANKGLEHSQSASGKALLYNNRGTAHRLQGDLTSAISDYNLALSVALSPQEKRVVHPSIITNQGIIYYLQEEYDQAKAYFQQAQNLMPGFFRALAGLAISRFKMGQIDEARKIWNELIQREPRYQDTTWLQTELNWPMEMMADTTELIDKVGA